MSDDELTPERVTEITGAVDIDAPPPSGEATALLVFGTNQAAPAVIAAARYHRGAAPVVIVTGGVNRHDGVVEGREFARLLTAAEVPPEAILIEDQSADTWQNVELSLPYLAGALELGLRLTVVSKWYHLRAVHVLRTLLPDAAPFYALSYEPLYAGVPVTRKNWPGIPDGRRRVVREFEEVPRRVADGSYLAARKAGGAWRLCSGHRVPTRRRPAGSRTGGASRCSGKQQRGNDAAPAESRWCTGTRPGASCTQRTRPASCHVRGPGTHDVRVRGRSCSLGKTAGTARPAGAAASAV